MLDDLLADMQEKEVVDTCKWLFFRCTKSRCITSHDGILEKTELRLLKKISCPGCDKCGWIIDFMREDIDMYDDNDSYIGNCKHGKIYTPRVVTSREWESSTEEIDYIDFIEVEDDNG